MALLRLSPDLPLLVSMRLPYWVEAQLCPCTLVMNVDP